MNELVKQLMGKANLDELAAKKVLEVVKQFLGDKLPDGISDQVMKALDGVDVSDAAGLIDGVKDMFGSK